MSYNIIDLIGSEFKIGEDSKILDPLSSLKRGVLSSGEKSGQVAGLDLGLICVDNEMSCKLLALAFVDELDLSLFIHFEHTFRDHIV